MNFNRHQSFADSDSSYAGMAMKYAPDKLILDT